MKSKRVANLEIPVNNLMAILDILEDYETEFRYHNIDFEKFLENFGWTTDQYFNIYKDIENILTDAEAIESFNYVHTWEKFNSYD